MSHPQSTFGQTQFHGKSLLSIRRNTIAQTSIHTQLEQLRSTGRYDCFKLKWHPIYDDKSMWPVPFHLFWDSDVAKWIEAACYLLEEQYDAEIDVAVRELVEMIRSAQQDDGYLNVHYTVVEPGKRWSNVKDMHELYNAGHLIEAALAHRAYYKNDLLIEPIVKYVNYIRNTFGPGENQLHGYPGHPEIELALLRLYSATSNQDAYDLAKYFLEERGNPTGQDSKHYYDWETEQRGDNPWARPDSYPEHRSFWVNQAHLPILEQQTIEGHSVRAMYLLVAVADLVHLSRDTGQKLPDSQEWVTTLNRLWDNMVDRRMYVTGGIGAIKQWEGFGVDYFLPQSTDEGGCYAETCASISVMMLAERLLHLDLDSRYGDIMELSLYNNVMTAMSLGGKEFTYVNQLASSDEDKSVRYSWFWCACCPPNLARLYGSLGGYLWDYGSQEQQAFINVHLFTTAKVSFEANGSTVVLEQQSNWPWEGDVTFQATAPESVQTTIRLRLPAWSQYQYELTPSASADCVKLSKGYLCLAPAYVTAHPSFILRVKNFSPRHIMPHPHTNQNTLTLARGPIIYCAEDIDNPWETNHFKDIIIKQDSPVVEERRVSEETGEDYVVLKTQCWRRILNDWEVTSNGQGPGMGVSEQIIGDEREIVFVPYYFRSNRGGKGHMRVGFLKN
ncbi:hypothetical protein BGZ61DRAFT_433674 [Ilyonectria robusta]|uniref:uncharacterized protein n=1 Tax=Ilyonectria robusta TaxID=1079257 RepID=UPI001E8D41B6|nr:uncharacterized protein BGZ61DRAFT_433674 [Ilyonectria robusta]KAH8658976.1 hypothetical protein BGZ61DRAFT_433674 [Ilyonectria robusta]